MPKVIVNSTPLISLYKIKQLNLLKQLYSEIYIPYGVYEELPADDKYNFLTELSFIKIQKIKNDEAKKFFKTSLHKGEVEVMILAEEINADLCIIDDLLARKYAKYLRYTITGTRGGESIRKAQERSIPIMEKLLDEFKGKSIVIGTHGNIMTIIINYYNKEYGFNFWDSTSMPDVYKLSFVSNELKNVERLWNPEL